MKKTNRVRVVTDFVIEFPEPLPCAPSFGTTNGKRLVTDLIVDGFRDAILEIGEGYLHPGGLISIRLDYRKAPRAYESTTNTSVDVHSKKSKTVAKKRK